MFKMLKNQKGMTLVELLAVMVIVGIIAAISIPAIGNLMENSRKDAHIANAQNLHEAARLWVTSNESYLTQIYTNNPGAKVKISLSQGSWGVSATKSDQENTSINSNINKDAPFTGYLETFKDPHTKGDYTAAFIEITKSGDNYHYEVYMDGAKVDIGSQNKPIDPTTLTRANVS